MHIHAILMERMMYMQSVFILPRREPALTHSTQLLSMGIEIFIMPPGGVNPMHST